jgi:hypothetical protein
MERTIVECFIRPHLSSFQKQQIADDACPAGQAIQSRKSLKERRLCESNPYGVVTAKGPAIAAQLGKPLKFNTLGLQGLAQRPPHGSTRRQK